jgi:L,D-transpeptidase YcbB
VRSAWRNLWRALILSALIAGAAQAQSGIQGLVTAGTIREMRWPDFRDVRPAVQEFYGAAYAPAWLTSGQPTAQAQGMIQIFADAWKKGLQPEDYDSSRWSARIQALHSGAGDPAIFDVALTVCTMRYVSALRVGRINPKHLKFDFHVGPAQHDLADFVRADLLPSSQLSATLDSIEPPFAGYRRTEFALVHYVELARTDDGAQLPALAKALDPGQEYPGTPRLVRFLQLVGDLPNDAALPSNPNLYDGAVVDAVKRFQSRHGLDADGRLGPATLKQLNLPLSDRVQQLQTTLERWRWLPEDFSAPPIVVNIPEFRLRALDRNKDEKNDENNGRNYKVALEMRVVVGIAMRTETPVFSRDMTFVVLRPYWNVPPGILRRSVIPALKKNPNELTSKNYEITTLDGTVVTSSTVSEDVLARLQAGKLAVRQKPGPNNALGLVKLMFPNEYSVYLHSTPATELFSKSRRDFSAGCIRVAEPAELTAWVLRYNPGWDLQRVREGMESGKDNVTVKLARPVPVFIVYGTALAEENGEVHFYDDIYGHDAKLKTALAKGYPYPQ